MLKELKFVQGAVAKKDLIPELTHFRIEDGTIRSYNGKLALSSPIAFDFNCTPKAIPMVKAISNCEETVVMNMTPTGRLSIKSGKFKAFIECVEDEVTPHVVPEGNEFEVDGEVLLKAFKTLEPFISEDASKPWSRGILLREQSAFATNNVIAAEYWIGADVPFECNIPQHAIKEILRIKETPIRAQVNEVSLSLHYEDGKWLRTNILDTQWPDVGALLNREHNAQPIPVDLFEGLTVVKPFCDKLGRVYLQGNKLMTTITETDGAIFEVDGMDCEGAFNVDMLLKLEGIADSLDLSCYPAPSAFFGGPVRGVIMGVRTQ